METIYATNDFSLVIKGKSGQKIEFSSQKLKI